jgi:hypothetical protein
VADSYQCWQNSNETGARTDTARATRVSLGSPSRREEGGGPGPAPGRPGTSDPDGSCADDFERTPAFAWLAEYLATPPDAGPGPGDPDAGDDADGLTGADDGDGADDGGQRDAGGGGRAPARTSFPPGSCRRGC